MDRAGLSANDGPTHHGAFDIGYLRLFPNLAVLAPGDEHDLSAMLDWALAHNGPVAIRYPKAVAGDFDGDGRRITEMDALVAYLQMLGTLVRFTDVRLEDLRQ